jgi:hypothetical protein
MLVFVKRLPSLNVFGNKVPRERPYLDITLPSPSTVIGVSQKKQAIRDWLE